MKRIAIAALVAALGLLSAMPSFAADAGAASADLALDQEDLAVDTAATTPADPAPEVELAPPATLEPKNPAQAIATGANFWTKVRSRDYMAGFFVFIALLAFILRRIAEWKAKWFAASVWRLRAIVFTVALCTELLTAYGAGQSPSPGMFLAALALALGGSGVWHNRPAAARGDGIITSPLRG